MLHSIVDSIITDIETLSFADRVGGVVYPLQKNMNDEDGNTITKTFPIYKNTATACANEDYKDMIPDDRYKSLIYFESSSEDADEESTHQGQVTTTATLTMVAWFNMKAIAQTSRSAESMIRNIIYKVLRNEDMGDVRVVIELESIRFRDPNTFAAYTYDEAEKQHLIYPFDFGAVDFSVQLTYPICDAEPTSDADCFNT